jgi:hypothetical protein
VSTETGQPHPSRGVSRVRFLPPPPQPLGSRRSQPSVSPYCLAPAFSPTSY